MNENWKRISEVIQYSGKETISAFAQEIGLIRSENLYQIKRGNNGISKDLAELVCAKFPEISKGWLMTGEGEMIKSLQPTDISIGVYKRGKFLFNWPKGIQFPTNENELIIYKNETYTFQCTVFDLDENMICIRVK